MNENHVPLDNRQVPLEVGQEVAYNMSGEVAKGIIRSVSHERDLRYGQGFVRFKTLIKIELQHDAGGKHKGHISKVTNPHNALVLKERPNDE